MNSFSWIFSHKKLIFLYLPLFFMAFISIYTGSIYMSWLNDRDDALLKLMKYKKLIDKTEDMKEGYIYNYNEIDHSVKVVDLPTRIYDRNNEIIGEFFEQKREIVPYHYIPKWLVNGVIASEDRAFKNHNGINYMGIFRAMLVNLSKLSIKQGGSTITQQLAKVLFTDMERSIKRKIYEAFCAIEIEKKYDKDDILSMYLNLIYFGNGSYGVESTSKMFFGVSVKELNIVECAVIVSTISSPKSYSPISNLKNSIAKTERILKSMVDAGFISKRKAEYEYKQFLSKWDVKFNKEGKAISSLIGSFLYSSYRVNRAPFFNERIRRILVKRFGESSVKRGGLSVYTTIDGDKQDVALKSLRDGISNQREYHLKKSNLSKNKKKKEKELQNSKNIEGAFVSLNPATGEIIAYVGGAEFSSSNQYDHVSQIRRQPGSSFKPFVYVSAIESQVITPSSVFLDEKTVFENGYSPNNYNNKFSGEIIVREALRKSVNVVAVKVLQKSGYSKLFDFLSKSLNFDKNHVEKRFGKTLSLALGTYEISPLENSILHSTIVNGGNYIEPYGIRTVKDYNGKIVWDNKSEVLKRVSEKRKIYGTIITPQSSAVVISMLKGVFEKGGTAYWVAKKRNIKFPIAGKTGTSTNFNDAWFVGYTSNLVSVVWIGNKKGAISLGKGRAGGVVAGPVWGNYISSIYGENPPKDFLIPKSGITFENICSKTGLVAHPSGFCPSVIKKQIFLSGSEPGEFCKIHLDKENNTLEEKKYE